MRNYLLLEADIRFALAVPSIIQSLLQHALPLLQLPPFLPRNLRGIEEVVRPTKHIVHLLQTQITRLREQEVHSGDDGGVDASVDDPVAVADVGETNRRDQDDEEVRQPGGGGRHACDGGSVFQRSDLGGIQIRVAQEAEGEEGGVEEEEEGGCVERAFVLRRGSGAGHDAEADGHCRRTQQHQRPTTESIDGQDCSQAAKDQQTLHGNGQPTSFDSAETQVLFVDGGRVRHRKTDAAELLKCLAEDGDQGTVEDALIAHFEQVLRTWIARAGGKLEGVLHHGDIAGDALIVDRHVLQDCHGFPGFVYAAFLDKPPWRLWQEEDECNDHQEEDDLDGEGEAPRDRGVLHEEEAKVDQEGNGDARAEEDSFYINKGPAVLCA